MSTIALTDSHIEQVKQCLTTRYTVSDDGQHWISTDNNSKLCAGVIVHTASVWMYMIEHGLRETQAKTRIHRICEIQHCIKADHQVLTSSPSWKVLEIEGDWTFLQHALDNRSQPDSDGCRVWRAHVNAKQYPLYENKPAAHWAYFLSHRVKQVPTGYCISRTCSNRLCIAASHLTLTELTQRHALGVKRKGAVLSAESARILKFSKGQGTRRERAEQAGVNYKLVASIDNGYCWSWLGKTPEEDTPKKNQSSKHPQVKKVEIAKDAQFYEDARTLIRTKHMVVDGNHWIAKYKTTTDNKYPRIVFRKTAWLLHILSWMAFNESTVPEGLVVRHKCVLKTSCCFNPDHLETGTQRDNVQDKFRDGTIRLGENASSATIDNETAKRVKASKGDGKQMDRAMRFDVSRAIVASIDSKQSWKHI